MVNRRFGSGDYGEKRKRWPILIFGLILTFLLWWGYQKFIGMSLTKANVALAEGNYQRSEALFKRVSNLPLTKSRGKDGLGALALLNGSPEAAKEHFQAVLERKPSAWGGDPQVILQAFMALGKYRAATEYKNFLTQWREESDLQPFFPEFAALALGARQPEEAMAYLDKFQGQSQLATDLNNQITAIQRQGYIPIMVDRNGAPIMVYDLNTESQKFISQRLFAGWKPLDGQEGLLQSWSGLDWEAQIQTTLDINLQKAANQSMMGYDGTMILMSPNSGEILAAYGTEGLDPFSESFEPGSVIKVLTLGSLLKTAPDLTKYAPKKYPSSITIGGKIFYDWTTQGMLSTVEEGMAVSCNLMFAQMGMDLGWPKLSQDLKMLFDRPLEDNILPNWASFGSVLRDPEGAYELGRFAIGLDMMASTALGVVMIPAAISNKGVIPHPRLVSGYNNPDGTMVNLAAGKDLGAVFQPQDLPTLKASMIAAVNDKRGTARRAKVDFVNAAMKTGTSGDRPFDTVMIGMLPVDQPKLVFGFFLKKGGKAEINGGKVAKNLQEQIKALAPDYLD